MIVSYQFVHRLLVERIGEIRYDMDRNNEEREELRQELKETEEALEELEEHKGNYFDGYA